MDCPNDNLPFEEWKDVPGYAGRYRVSTAGRVFSPPRRESRVPRILKQCASKRGDMSVHLSLDGNTKTARVHRLVLEAFVGPCPEGMECCHNDGNPANNRLDNLRWDTHANNMADRIKHGTNLGPYKVVRTDS